MVTVAEKAGKHVELLTVPGRDYYETLLRTAQQLDSSRIVTNAAPQLPPRSRPVRSATRGRHFPSLVAE